MKVFFVTQKNMRNTVLLKPRQPESAPLYEGEVPRICVSTSILGALSSIGGNLGLECYTYIYSCEVEEAEIIQPSTSVNDIDFTGEMWILKEKEFTLDRILKLKKENSFCIDKSKETEIYNFTFKIMDEKEI